MFGRPFLSRSARALVAASLAACFGSVASAPRLGAQTVAADTARTSSEPAFQRHFVGSSLFMVANLFPDPPSFFQLNYGYRVTPRDAISVEATTWKYNKPLGIPYGDSFGDPAEEYPGTVRGIGVGVAYQRMWGKHLYSALHAQPLLQRYADDNGKHIQNGFQLFMTFRTGYQIPLFSNRWFIEPSIAATAWPINSNVPAAFAARDRLWNRYFLFEPGLHFGRRF
jgi:hypothetical protein